MEDLEEIGNLFNELNKIEILSITKKNIDLDDVEIDNLSKLQCFELAKITSKIRASFKILNENNFANDECILF